MNLKWRVVLLRRLLLWLGIFLLIGVLTKQVAWALVVGLATLALWNLHYFIRLCRWVSSEDPSSPPEAHGLWGDIFDSIYRLERRHQRARAGLQAVIDRMQKSTGALKDAMVMLDRHGNLEWWNQAAERLLGFKLPVDRGRPITNLVRDPRFKSYFEAGNYVEPLEIPSLASSHIRLQFHITRYGEGAYLLMIRDVSRLYQLEQMRKDFVANVSHELRTPLTVLSGYLETLLDSPETQNSRWLRPIQQMQQQSERMSALLKDLLLLARLESTDFPMDTRPISVRDLLESIALDAEALSNEQHRILLKIEDDVHLHGSEAELRCAFSNLVFNAVKYTQAGGEITISCWLDDGEAYVQVADNGPGIAESHLPRLTERFYRVDAARASNTGGTGLGLAIVKHVLLRHHGELLIRSRLQEGSRFICCFQAGQVANVNGAA